MCIPISYIVICTLFSGRAKKNFLVSLWKLVNEHMTATPQFLNINYNMLQVTDITHHNICILLSVLIILPYISCLYFI